MPKVRPYIFLNEYKNNNVVSIDDHGTITAVAPGETEIYCVVTDSKGQSASAMCFIRVDENSGMGNVPAEENTAEEFFTLQGLRSGSHRSSLAPGIYIRRQGSEMTKIVVK